MPEQEIRSPPWYLPRGVHVVAQLEEKSSGTAVKFLMSRPLTQPSLSKRSAKEEKKKRKHSNGRRCATQASNFIVR